MKRIILTAVVALLCVSACAGGGSGTWSGSVAKQPLEYWYTDNWKPAQ